VPVLGAVPIQRLTSAHVQAFYSELLRGDRVVSARTVRYVHAILHRALKEAVGLGILSRNVTDAVAPPKAPRPPIKSWDVADARRFLARAATDRYHPLWLIALHTGMQRGELLGLRWADVDLARAVLRVRQAIVSVAYRPRVAEPKTASGRRTIAPDAVCVDALREHRANQGAHRRACGGAWRDHDLVFASAVGTPLDANTVSRRFVKLAAAAGVPRIPYHGLRHTHATLLMKAGVHPKVASERLGHASIMLTLQTYSHVLPQMQQEAAAIFAAAVGDGVDQDPSDGPREGTGDAPGEGVADGREG